MNIHLTSQDETGAAPPIADQRIDRRVTCNRTSVEVATLGFFPRTYSGTVQDRSLASVCIHLKRRLRTGAEIATVIDDELIFGRVEYAVPIPDAFKTGIQIRYTIRRSETASDLSRLADVLDPHEP